jgi:hypothetical protein
MSKHAECVDSAYYDCSKDVKCIDGGITSRSGYNCICNDGYTGNPYIPDGCSRDKGNFHNNTTIDFVFDNVQQLICILGLGT